MPNDPKTPIPASEEEAAWELFFRGEVQTMAAGLRRAERAFLDLEQWRKYRNGEIGVEAWKEYVSDRETQAD
jgi:hypothetical protein